LVEIFARDRGQEVTKYFEFTLESATICGVNFCKLEISWRYLLMKIIIGKNLSF